jgi:hypothetical protein
MTRRILTRWVSMILLALGFQILLKPMRMYVVHEALIPVGLYVQSDPSQFRLETSQSVGFHIADATNPTQKSSEWLAYTGFGNLYFLIGATILILMGRNWRSILLLLGIHVILSLISGGFLLLGLWSNSIGWMYAMDFTVSKAVPAATGLYVLMKRGTVDG